MADKFKPVVSKANLWSRRSFLRFTAVSSAAVAGNSLNIKDALAMHSWTGKTDFEQYPYTEKLIHRPKDGFLPDKVVNSGCSFCPSNCRHKVHIKDGRVMNVYGEPDDPVQDGGLCAKGQSIPQLLYNKYRITKPMKRKGSKPSDVFEPITWEQALTEIAQKLIDIRDNTPEGAKGVAAKASGRQTREVGAMQWRFFELYGSPNTTHEGYICNDAGGIALGMTLGKGGQTNGYGYDPITKTEDLGDSKYILWFGTNDAECHPVLHSYMKKRKNKAGTKWVVVDPRFTMTANGADLWLPIKPGTDMAFIYGMLHHIISNNLEDKKFVEKWVAGFEELKKFINEKGYSPEWAEKITGISKDTIKKIAEDYAKTKPAAIITNAGIAHQVNAVDTFRTLIFLSAITGNIGIHGGGANFMHNSPIGVSLPPIKIPLNPPFTKGGVGGIIEAGLPPQPDYFVRAVNTGKPYKLRAIFYAGNMLTQNSNTKEVEEALKKLDLFVSFNLFPQEDTYYADYILPTTTFYEVDHVGVRRCDRGIRWRNKCVDPIGEAKNDPDIWIELGQMMAKLDKKNPPEYWTENLDIKWKDKKYLWNQVSPKNNPTAAGMTADRMDKLSVPLRWPCPGTDHPGTSVMFLDNPKWKDIWGGKRFPNAIDKVEIYTKELDDKLKPTGHSALPEFYTSPENMDGHPTLEYTDEFIKSPTVSNTSGGNLIHKVKIGIKPDEKLRKEYPFQLITGRNSALHFHTITHWAWNLTQISGDIYAQIHPKLAEQIKVQTGDFIKVETPRGAMEMPALVWDGIQPNTIFIPISFGNKQKVHQDVERRIWDTVNNLTSNVYYDTLSGQQGYKAYLCKITSIPGKRLVEKKIVKQ
ncbi:MAG: molybdopterin-dependent oxidoreductase [Nitrospinae bacterium]|nr:molybdopterin-dependent oxidoreductase [Nitrospinota bacterium]